MMANGELTKILVHTDVTRYLEFKQVRTPAKPVQLRRKLNSFAGRVQIAGSYVRAAGRVAKVPSTEMEAVRSPLMGLFEKRRAKKFMEWVAGYDKNNPATHQGGS